MKKYICMALAVVMVFSCAACGGGNPTASTTTTTATTTTTLTPTPVSSFEYEAVNDGIVITKYIGTDKNVVVPEMIGDNPVTELQYMTFWQNKDIESVVLPQALVKIGSGAFEECTSLTTVVLPAGLQEIGFEAFLKCEKLTGIKLPASLNQIGGMAFSECVSIKEITIPENCMVGGEAFAKCSSLKHIKIPQSCNLMDSVFIYSGLETVELEEGIESIPYECFVGTNIRSITLPKTVKEIQGEAFADCENLETVILNEGLEKVGDEAFGGTKITEIVIPSTVTDILDTSFSRCSKLDKIKFEGDAPKEFLWIHKGVDGQDIRIEAQDVHFTIYYHEGAAGFTSPEWFGYPTAIW